MFLFYMCVYSVFDDNLNRLSVINESAPYLKTNNATVIRVESVEHIMCVESGIRCCFRKKNQKSSLINCHLLHLDAKFKIERRKKSKNYKREEFS